jgi:ketosteroid isomerase-like protein
VPGSLRDTARPVSQENVEIVRRAFDAFEHDGVAGLLRHFDPRIEWTTTGAFPEASTYRGHEGVRRYLGAMLNEFDDLRNEPEEFTTRASRWWSPRVRGAEGS